jgi:osmoprotectant transport system permease protein
VRCVLRAGPRAETARSGFAAWRARIAGFWRYCLVGLALLVGAPCTADETLRIGSKRFTESTILGEILTQTAQRAGSAEHVPGLGNTAIVFEALRSGAIDLYPEYLGTIELEILHHRRAGATLAQVDQELAPLGLGVGIPLGFENSYAIGVRRDTAQALHLACISDLARYPQLRIGLSHEFLGRADGWPGLARHYGLTATPTGLDHGLAYEALAAHEVDAIDLYTTDAKIARYGIEVLLDDRHYFPRYDAVVMYRRSVPQRFPQAWAALQTLAGRIDENRMIELNGAAELDHRAARDIARSFLEQSGSVAMRPGFRDRLFGEDFGRLARQHVLLVLLSVAAASAIGIPLGVAAARWRALGSAILAVVGALQTIPALALLAALIPVLGAIGTRPALLALFIFALLPIVRNTAVGLAQVPAVLREAATALGARSLSRLWLIELPLASPVILAGIRTAAVISVGTATIAAFVGAGGFGERIAIGLALNDHQMLLAGALPAAAMALAFEALFGALEWLARRPGRG